MKISLLFNTDMKTVMASRTGAVLKDVFNQIHVADHDGGMGFTVHCGQARLPKTHVLKMKRASRA